MLGLNAILQLRQKKFWWMDLIFYFSISAAVAAGLCYGVFLIKNNMQRSQIEEQVKLLESVGTDQQKEQEQTVLSLQKKINDYVGILKNHQFASNAFAFMESQTMPNVWFQRFVMNRKNAVIDLTGESDDQEVFSRQVASFEKNKYVQSVTLLNSGQQEEGKIVFNLSIALEPSIFNYLADVATSASSQEQALIQNENQEENQTTNQQANP